MTTSASAPCPGSTAATWTGYGWPGASKTGKFGSFQTSPIIRDGVMYITTPYNDIIALRADSGKVLWRYSHELPDKTFCCGPANRGPAVTDDKVFSVTIDARLIALERDTGKVIWDVAITDTDAGKAEQLDPLLGVDELKGATQSRPDRLHRQPGPPGLCRQGPCRHIWRGVRPAHGPGAGR